MASSATTTETISAVSTSHVKFEEIGQEAASSSVTEFTNVPLEGGAPDGERANSDTQEKKKKVPRRILHFSDGTLEEYSTDEEDDDEVDSGPAVDPRTLTWFPWLWYYMVSVSSGALAVADICGEKLAWFFGITSPKYQYAIDEFNRMKREEEEEQARGEREKDAERRRMTEDLSQVEGAYESTYKAPSVPSSSVTTETQHKTSAGSKDGTRQSRTEEGVVNKAFNPEKF